MKITAQFLSVAVFLGFSLAPLHAANKWFDNNGAVANSGVTSGSLYAVFNGQNNWSTSSAGTATTGPFTSGTDAAFYSAGGDATGSFTASAAAACTLASINVEEGSVHLTGSALTTQTITVANGAALYTLASGQIVSSAGATCTLNGGRLGRDATGTGGNFLGTSSAFMSVVLGTGGGTVSMDGGAGIVTIYQGLIQGTGPLTVAGNGIFRLTTTTATYSGGTIITGTLQLSTTANVLPSGTDMTINSGGKLDLQTSVTVGSLTGAGSVVENSNGALIIGGSASPAAFSGAISGGGTVTYQGTGTLTLSGANSFTKTLTLSSGTITVNSGGALCGTVCDVTVNGGALNLNNAAQTIENLTGTGGTITLGTGHTLTTTAAASGTYSGTISGAGALTKTDANNLTLSGPNNYTGATTIGAGALLTVANNTALGTAAGTTSVTSGGAVQVSGSLTGVTEPITLNGTGISSGGALRNTSGGNTWSAAVTLGSSGVRINSDTSTLTLSGGVSGSGNPALTIGGAGNVTISTTALNIGSGTLTKDGAGQLLISVASTMGAVSHSGGLIKYDVNGALGSGTITVGSSAVEIGTSGGSGTRTLANDMSLSTGANLRLYGGSGVTLDQTGTINGNGALLRDDTGSGTLKLSGPNGYSGGFKVTSRGMRLNHKQALGTGTFTLGDSVTVPANTITITADAALTGANAVGNAVNWNQDFTLAAVNNLELSGPVTMSPATVSTRVASRMPSGH